MTARKSRAAAVDDGLEDLGRDTTDALGHSRDQLIAIEAARPWAVRILLAAAIGDRGDALRRALAFLIGHFYNGKMLEARRMQLRQVLDRKAPGLSVLVVPRDTVAAVQDAALALGVAIGMQMRATAEDLKVARSGMMCDAGGVKAAVAENRRAIGEKPYQWQCDDLGGVR